jgi:hypothetical protein
LGLRSEGSASGHAQQIPPRAEALVVMTNLFGGKPACRFSNLLLFPDLG